MKFLETADVMSLDSEPVGQVPSSAVPATWPCQPCLRGGKTEKQSLLPVLRFNPPPVNHGNRSAGLVALETNTEGNKENALEPPRLARPKDRTTIHVDYEVKGTDPTSHITRWSKGDEDLGSEILEPESRCP